MSDTTSSMRPATPVGPVKAPDHRPDLQAPSRASRRRSSTLQRLGRSYYRFLFGGLLMLVGCFMPFDANWDHVGYKSLSGGVRILVIALRRHVERVDLDQHPQHRQDEVGACWRRSR
ncbi:MAG: hypothetical protein R3F30_04285 [Planctomycetota bacterium]